MRPLAIDLDGTLVDSVLDIHAATNAVLQTLDLAPRSTEEIRAWVGNGSERLLARAITGSFDGDPPAEQLEAANHAFDKHYPQANGQFSQPYPGVVETLKQLIDAGTRMACVTNKPARFARHLLELHGLNRAFEFTLGGDSLSRRKPHPLPLLFVAGQFSIAPAALTLIGDSISDVRAARAAGCSIIAVSYGYNHGQDIRSEAPDAVIDGFAELPGLLSP